MRAGFRSLKKLNKKHIHRWKHNEPCCPIHGCYEAECRCGAIGHFNSNGKLEDIYE